MVFGARIEELFTSAARGRHALVLEAKVPPGSVVRIGLDLAGKDLPAPLVDQQPEGEERDFVERARQQETDIP